MLTYFEGGANSYSRLTVTDLPGVIARLPKEGAKFNIGMGIPHITRSTITPRSSFRAKTETSLSRTLSSQDEARVLIVFRLLLWRHRDEILRSKTRGYVRMLNECTRFYFRQRHAFTQIDTSTKSLMPHQSGHELPGEKLAKIGTLRFFKNPLVNEGARLSQDASPESAGTSATLGKHKQCRSLKDPSESHFCPWWFMETTSLGIVPPYKSAGIY